LVDRRSVVLRRRVLVVRLAAMVVDVGQPRVHNFRARMHGRIRNGREARWIPLAAEQYNFVDNPARLFYLTGSMFTIPVQGISPLRRRGGDDDYQS
jgi:hypothetical protein